MDYIKQIDRIINKLRSSNYIDFSDLVTERKSNAFTSSELLSSVTYELLKLVRNNTNLNRLIGKDVNELKDYCWSIGLHIKQDKNNYN